MQTDSPGGISAGAVCLGANQPPEAESLHWSKRMMMVAAYARVAVPCGWSMLPSLVPTPEIRPVATAHDSAGSA